MAWQAPQCDPRPRAPEEQPIVEVPEIWFTDKNLGASFHPATQRRSLAGPWRPFVTPFMR